ncbi:MAG TPA: hypothetical protein VFC38_06945 [Stellaceae bacterium]|nr:hypothetical protein [Stellaceae bacterium]
MTPRNHRFIETHDQAARAPLEFVADRKHGIRALIDDTVFLNIVPNNQ